jgi:hypothetical protein
LRTCTERTGALPTRTEALLLPEWRSYPDSGMDAAGIPLVEPLEGCAVVLHVRKFPKRDIMSLWLSYGCPVGSSLAHAGYTPTSDGFGALHLVRPR